MSHFSPDCVSPRSGRRAAGAWGMEEINHGRTRTELTNVRVLLDKGERKRRLSVLVCGSNNYMLVCDSNPFVLCDDSIPSKLFAMEVHDIPNRQTRCLEVVHELGLVFRQNRLDGLKLENDLVAADEVGDVLLLKRPSAKVYRQWMFALERYVGVAKRDGKCLLIDGLEKSGAEFVEYVHADSENFVGHFSICKHLVFPLDDGFLFNHGRTRTELTNVRIFLDKGERKRRLSVLVCGSLQRFERAGVEKKIDNIHPIDAVMVERRVVVEREQELRVIVAD